MSTETLGIGNGLGPPNSRMPGGRAPSRHCQGICGQQTQQSSDEKRGLLHPGHTPSVGGEHEPSSAHRNWGPLGARPAWEGRTEAQRSAGPHLLLQQPIRCGTWGDPIVQGGECGREVPGQTGPGMPRSLPVMPRSMVHRVWVREEEARIPGQTVSAGRTRLGEHNSALERKAWNVRSTGQVPRNAVLSNTCCAWGPRHVKHFPDTV